MYCCSAMSLCVWGPELLGGILAPPADRINWFIHQFVRVHIILQTWRLDNTCNIPNSQPHHYSNDNESRNAAFLNQCKLVLILQQDRQTWPWRMAMKQTDVSIHLFPNTPMCPRATGSKRGREGGPFIFSPTLLPGKLNLLMRSAAATCLLQLARQFRTHPRSMHAEL